jgi:DNA-binding response OmpR family regulator
MNRQILVVDDDVGLLSLVGLILTRGGFTVLKAENAFGALSLLETSKPDVIILDIMMPGMDGFELCRRIRALPQHRYTPVIMLSARCDSESVKQGIRAGANDYLSKVNVYQELTKKVYSMLEIRN